MHPLMIVFTLCWLTCAALALMIAGTTDLVGGLFVFACLLVMGGAACISEQ